MLKMESIGLTRMVSRHEEEGDKLIFITAGITLINALISYVEQIDNRDRFILYGIQMRKIQTTM